MTYSNNYPTTFYDNLHKDYHINFQLNRFLAYLGKDEFENIRRIGQDVNDFEQWKKELISLAEKKLKENDKISAGYYFRAAEFFMFRDDPNKKTFRGKALDLLKEGFNVKDNHHLVPYEYKGAKGKLPAYLFDHPKPKDTLVIMGGGDSYIEEWLPIFLPIREQGYRLIIFETPGQGGAFEDYNLTANHEYHIAAKSVLDYFKLENVCFWGISGGGLAAIRVAAYEKRVQRVVSHDIMFDTFDLIIRTMNPAKQFMLTTLVNWNASGIINMLVNAAMRKNLSVKGIIKQGMMIFGAKTPFEYLKEIKKLKTEDISHLVDQDVLLLGGTEDFVVPVDHFYKQIEALKNVRSLNARLFTRKEQAQNHCQVGNIGLALDTILNWVDHIKEGHNKWGVETRILN